MRPRGLTLIEVVCATCVLAGVLFTLGVALPRATMAMRNHGYEARAVELCERLMEEIRGMDSADVRPGTYTAAPPTAPRSVPRAFPPTPFPSHYAIVKVDDREERVTYNFTVTVTNVPLAPAPPGSALAASSGSLRQVVIDVTWKEPRGGREVDREWRLASYVSQ
jgi:hypothetical protein